MRPWELILSDLARLKILLAEFYLDGSVFIFDGIRWSQPPLELMQKWHLTTDWFSMFVQTLPADVRLKHKNKMDWKTTIEVETLRWQVTFRQKIKTLRFYPKVAKLHDIESWGISEQQMRQLTLPGIFTVLSGPKLSGKSSLQKVLFQKVGKFGVLPAWHYEIQELVKEIPRIMVFCDTDEFDVNLAYDLSLRGQSVCIALEAYDLESTLLQIFHRIPSVYHEKLIDQLLIIETRMLPGISDKLVPACSFYRLKHCPENLIKQKDWRGLTLWNESAKDQAFIRTLNTSLVNLLIKRQIDFDTAFAVSTNPEGLDLLLKRVGV